MRCSHLSLIRSNKWSAILQDPRTAFQEHFNKMAKDDKSKRSTKTAQTSTEGELRAHPYGLAMVMGESFGVLENRYHKGGNPSTQEQLGLAAAYFPANYMDIKRSAEIVMIYPVMPSLWTSVPSSRIILWFLMKGGMDRIFAAFLNPLRWNNEYYAHRREKLLVAPGLLPPNCQVIKPDLCIGIDPHSLGMRRWIAKHLPGPIRNRTIICANGLVEYKSAKGSIPAAVS